jgi:hypothetical protein
MSSPPDQSRQLVIAGDSHVFALGIPHTPGLEEAVLVPMANDRVEMLAVDGPCPRPLAYWQDVVRFSEGRSAAISWCGNQHHQFFLFAPSPLFDFVMASRPDLPLEETAELVPEAMVRQVFWPTVAILGAMLGELASKGCSRAFVLGTPPPKGDDDRVRAYLSAEPGLVALAAERGFAIADVPLTPPLVRLKLWRVVQEMMAELAGANGASFVEVPPEAQDDTGFLRPEYWVPDATHANHVYGQLLLNRLLDRVTQ